MSTCRRTTPSPRCAGPACGAWRAVRPTRSSRPVFSTPRGASRTGRSSIAGRSRTTSRKSSVTASSAATSARTYAPGTAPSTSGHPTPLRRPPGRSGWPWARERGGGSSGERRSTARAAAEFNAMPPRPRAPTATSRCCRCCPGRHDGRRGIGGRHPLGVGPNRKDDMIAKDLLFLVLLALSLGALRFLFGFRDRAHLALPRRPAAAPGAGRPAGGDHPGPEGAHLAPARDDPDRTEPLQQRRLRARDAARDRVVRRGLRRPGRSPLRDGRSLRLRRDGAEGDRRGLAARDLARGGHPPFRGDPRPRADRDRRRQAHDADARSPGDPGEDPDPDRGGDEERLQPRAPTRASSTATSAGSCTRCSSSGTRRCATSWFRARR